MLAILLPGWLIGVTTFTVMLVVVLFWGGLILLPVALLKALLPFSAAQKALSPLMAAIASQWVASDQLVFRVLHAPTWHLDSRSALDPAKTYLLISNHQSWADILILFDLMHGRAPFLRFFLKKELIWVPLIGLLCWALDMPFMKRHSREAIAANQALRGEDLRTTRHFCEKFRSHPITVVNFLEGTRFSEGKRVRSQSPYRHLLRPKAAGLSFMLNAMGEQFGGIIDVTIAYEPCSKSLLWSWMCGEQNQMAIDVDAIPIPVELLRGDYDMDEDFRSRFQTWVNVLWSRKDARLDHMRASAHVAPSPRLT